MDTTPHGRKTINYRTRKPQQYFDAWTQQIETVTYAGDCVRCGSTTYSKSSGNDPRGCTGLHHTAAPLVAEEYGMVGHDVPACYGCSSNDATAYKQVLKIAKSRWAAK